MKTIQLKDIPQGLTTFEGIDRETKSIKVYEWSDSYEDSERTKFILGGVTYLAKEDPSDGYRSSMIPLEILRRNAKVKNTFNPIQVFVKHYKKTEHGFSSDNDDDILVVMNMKGEAILEIGTSNVDDYYPSYICNYSAEALNETND